MDAFELLKADHDKVAELFDRMEAASGKAKLDVFKQIKSELELHAHIEETIFYPAIEKPRETHDLTLEAYEEHKVVKTLLAELGRAKTASETWQAKAKVLRENVEHHVKEEEKELFDKADDVLSDEEIEALGNRMDAEKARKQGRPAPAATNAKARKKAKASANEPGILTKIADFVGIGTGRKKAAKKSSKKKTAARTGAKTGSKKATGNSASKSAAKSSSKQTKRGASAASASSRKSGRSGATKKAKKK